MAWLLNGQKFAHLQTLSPGREGRIGELFDLSLYTIGPTKTRYAVGTIDNVRIISDEEAEGTLSQFKKLGWLKQMQEDLRAVGADFSELAKSGAVGIFNAVFDPRDVRMYEPLEALDGNDPRLPRSSRYSLSASLIEPPSPGHRSRRGSSTPTKTALRAIRKGTALGEIDLAHTRLQNALHKYLTAEGKSVSYEAGHVDLTVHLEDKDEILELKTGPTAKGCIREAIGQLLEYAHYARPDRSHSLVVVGRVAPTDSDRSYLQALEAHYKIGLQYWHFDESLSILTKFDFQA